jgi:hypothetical protein
LRSRTVFQLRNGDRRQTPQAACPLWTRAFVRSSSSADSSSGQATTPRRSARRSAAEGIKTLEAYRKDWDEDRGAWRNKPRHDFSSHGADGFRTGVAIPYREMVPPKDDPKPTKMQTRWPTFKELTDEHDRRMKHRRARI